jgi:hypothetical protein
MKIERFCKKLNGQLTIELRVSSISTCVGGLALNVQTSSIWHCLRNTWNTKAMRHERYATMNVALRPRKLSANGNLKGAPL